MIVIIRASATPSCGFLVSDCAVSRGEGSQKEREARALRMAGRASCSTIQGL